jgi:hypothetical protein
MASSRRDHRGFIGEADESWRSSATSRTASTRRAPSSRWSRRPPAPGRAQQAIVDRIAAPTAAFDDHVLLVQGDTHTYEVDDPLGLPNFTRIVVHGETLPCEYLCLTIDPKSEQLLSWERRPVG